jgi:hypothetical protein
LRAPASPTLDASLSAPAYALTPARGGRATALLLARSATHQRRVPDLRFAPARAMAIGSSCSRSELVVTVAVESARGVSAARSCPLAWFPLAADTELCRQSWSSAGTPDRAARTGLIYVSTPSARHNS